MKRPKIQYAKHVKSAAGWYIAVFTVNNIDFTGDVYEKIPPNEMIKTFETFSAYVPDGYLRRRLHFYCTIWYPFNRGYIFNMIVQILNIKKYIYIQCGISPIKMWDKRFFKYKLSGDFLRDLMDLMIEEDCFEGVAICEQKLAEIGALDERGRFEL